MKKNEISSLFKKFELIWFEIQLESEACFISINSFFIVCVGVCVCVRIVTPIEERKQH